MWTNYFTGFRRFTEDEQAPGYFATVKKQQRIPKKLWLGMPFSIGADKTIKLDGKLFKGPMTFYVTEFDDKTVTMKLVRNPMDFSNADDPDDEVDPENTNDGEEQNFTIPRSQFEELLEPNQFPGADFASASSTALQPR